MSFTLQAILVALLCSFSLGQDNTTVCACNDEAPQAAEGEEQFTCAQQKEFGQCDADFMLGFCECTCDRCCPCNDFPPFGKAFTCLQQKEFGKCDDDFMVGFCECECGRCPALTGETVPEVVVEPTPVDLPTEVTSEPEVPEVVIEPQCLPPLIPIFGTSPVQCETVRCAQNRQNCGNRCGGLAQIDFDCEDVSNGGSRSFSSSCACAGK
eukprot:TRINITY_DN1398_c0_g1_i2.p1 TRINITY_DN1398_c0_g1~~TRINITY_DN1398_c0_g1_i2.p1  ORF type:complete len:233 (+),score=28.14 TRINITY_DN1398_c0_g1_i2:70-699(+)